MQPAQKFEKTFPVTLTASAILVLFFSSARAADHAYLKISVNPLRKETRAHV